MGLITGAFSTYAAIGNREDLINRIFNVDPDEVPFMTSINRDTATATLHEWQTDILATAANNAQLEGDEVTRAASTPTVRLTNNTQISRKDATVTGTQQAVDKAGRTDELAYQMSLRTRELRRDMETGLLANKAKVAGDTTTARELAGIESWIATNTDRGATGTDPTGDGSDTAGAGTPRAFLETQLQTVLQKQFDSASGAPDTIMVGSARKQELSAFIGRTQARQNVDAKTISAAADLYMGDFGDQKVVPNRFQVQTSALVLRTDMWALASLRFMEDFELAKIGDADTRVILSEYTLEARNEKASGIVADLGG